MLLIKESVLSLKKKQHNIGVSTFKLPESTYLLFLMISVYDNKAIGSTSIVYILHMGIIS